MRRGRFLMLSQHYLAAFQNDAEFETTLGILLLILYKANYRDGIAYITANDIVDTLGAHRSHVDRRIAFLIRKGLISKVNGKGRSKHFRLSFWSAPKRKESK